MVVLASVGLAGSKLSSHLVAPEALPEPDVPGQVFRRVHDGHPDALDGALDLGRAVEMAPVAARHERVAVVVEVAVAHSTRTLGFTNAYEMSTRRLTNTVMSAISITEPWMAGRSLRPTAVST